MVKLKCEIDTPEMGERVLAAFESWFDDDTADSFETTYEHGQWWITRPATGAQWSVVDASGGRSVDGFDFEQVSEGEEE